ncbi:uncharacterized protein LOC143495888 [Brachyhypopomus gauderio]|uniref:uncharacterized protein LOC143495888 n=1 Tax=Brachyhypopomus gauderio TaxID=698409 RepID=UPI00404280AF
MSKMEYLNSFFINRLMAVAGEIFEAVKDTVSEYQEETERTKQENRRLMSILSEINANFSKERQIPDVQESNASRAISEQQNINQGPLGSDPSLIQLKLELATVKQEADPHPNETPTSMSPYAENAHDTQTSHADGVLEQQIPCQGPQDSKPSLLQVKLELATIEDRKVSQQQSSLGIHDQDPADSGAFTALDAHGKISDDVHANSFLSPQSASCDSEAGYHNNTSLSATVLQSLERNHFNTMNRKQTYDQFSDAPAHSQSHLSKAFGCNEAFRRASSTNKHVALHHEDKQYCCDVCGKCYGYARVLKVHLKTHTAERPFHCGSCGKTFKLKNHLKDHERTHTGDKRYSCSACGMSFIWTNQVKVHIRNHHREQPATVISKSVRRGKHNIF